MLFLDTAILVASKKYKNVLGLIAEQYWVRAVLRRVNAWELLVLLPWA